MEISREKAKEGNDGVDSGTNPCQMLLLWAVFCLRLREGRTTLGELSLTGELYTDFWCFTHHQASIL